MGAIEDTRKVLQDLIAPELRALPARLDSLEKRMDGRLDSLDKRIDGLDKKIEDVDRRGERRHDEVMIALRQLMGVTFIQQRLAMLEPQQMAHR